MTDNAQDLLAPTPVVAPPADLAPVVAVRPANLTAATADLRRAAAREEELLAELERTRQARTTAEAEQEAAERAEWEWLSTLAELTAGFQQEADALLERPIGCASDVLTLSDDLLATYTRFRTAIAERARDEQQRSLGMTAYERARVGHDTVRLALLLAPAASVGGH